MKQYFVLCEELCPACQGSGWEDADEVESEQFACFTCDGKGRRTRKESLIDGMREIDEEQNKAFDTGLPWHRYAYVDMDAGTWLAHNEAASRLAHLLTGYEQWRSVDDMAIGLAFIPYLTFHGVRVDATDDGTLTLDVEGKRIALYNSDDRAGENIWSNHYLSKAWRGHVGTLGMLRLTSFGWSFVSYDELHALRRVHAEGVSQSASTEERKDD